jgi:hypothetical protein
MSTKTKMCVRGTAAKRPPPQKKIDADVKKFYETLGIPSTPLPPPVEFKLYDYVECSAGVSAGV